MLDARPVAHQALRDGERLAAVSDLSIRTGGEEARQQGVEVLGGCRRVVAGVADRTPGARQGSSCGRVAPCEQEGHRAVAMPAGVGRVLNERAGEVSRSFREALLPSEQAAQQDVSFGEVRVQFQGFAQVRLGFRDVVAGRVFTGRLRGLRFE